MRPTFLQPWQATFDVVDMRRCCNFSQSAEQNFLREPYTCTVTCILYENKVRNFSLEEACENNTSSEPKRLCHCHSVAQVWLKDFVVQTERRL